MPIERVGSGNVTESNQINNQPVPGAQSSPQQPEISEQELKRVTDTLARVLGRSNTLSEAMDSLTPEQKTNVGNSLAQVKPTELVTVLREFSAVTGDKIKPFLANVGQLSSSELTPFLRSLASAGSGSRDLLANLTNLNEKQLGNFIRNSAGLSENKQAWLFKSLAGNDRASLIKTLTDLEDGQLRQFLTNLPDPSSGRFNNAAKGIPSIINTLARVDSEGLAHGWAAFSSAGRQGEVVRAIAQQDPGAQRQLMQNLGGHNFRDLVGIIGEIEKSSARLEPQELLSRVNERLTQLNASAPSNSVRDQLAGSDGPGGVRGGSRAGRFLAPLVTAILPLLDQVRGGKTE